MLTGAGHFLRKRRRTMMMTQIIEKARILAVKNYSRLRKADLIRAIQEKEGNSPCYQAISGCQEQDCLWKPDCPS